MSDWETQKKALLPYLQRAAEIEAVDPKVAYYCRLYAVEQGIKLEQRDQKADDLLELVLNQLEKDKPHLVLDTNVDLEHCERFALSVYLKAKRRDEQGIADRDTAKAYYAAFNFIEILKQFGALSQEVENERRFAVFRAAEIKRCLDEGRQPPALVAPAATDRPGGGSQDHQQREQMAGDGPPLIDYDPGYVIGSKILFMDGQSNLFRKGIIRGKAQEVGGFFNIQAEDGTEHQLGALFLAPDLSEGGDVTYFFTDGRQMDCQVTEMNASEWPPVYTLQMEDGSIVTTNHSLFVLNSAPIATRESNNLANVASSPVDAAPAIQPVTSVTSSEANRRLDKSTSWLIRRDSRRANEPSSVPGDSVGTHVHSGSVVPGIPPVVPVRENDATMPGDLPPAYPSAVQQQPPRQQPMKPEHYYQDIPQYMETEHTAENTTVQVLNYDVVAKSTPAVPQRQPSVQRPGGFEPDAAAIQQATRCAHNATAALNFSDVEHAIQCLREALQCLTKPPSSS